MRKQIIEQYEWREKFCLSSLSLHQEKGNISAELISGKPENVSTTHLCHLQLKSFSSSFIMRGGNTKIIHLSLQRRNLD